MFNSMINKLFYIIYSYYHEGNRKSSDTPKLTTFLIFSACIISLIFTFSELYRRLSNPDSFSKGLSINQPLLFCSVLVSFAVTYFMFFYNGKHRRINELYKDDKQLNSTRGKVIGFALVFFLMFSPFVFLILGNFIVKAL